MGRDRSGVSTGIVLITVGLIFLADRQGYGGFHNLWPLILIVLGATKILFPRDGSMRVGVVAGSRGCREHRFSGLWLVLVGVIFLMNQNHILSISQSWPLFIVAAGVGIMFSGMLNRKDQDGGQQ
ncbi:MAG: hypothetical protein EPO35_05385 [Acidobacteria bacterium]|nr:MAG: hypothetical protein EPO35_05385 [Acidobacteriota bacterium]